MHNVAPPVTFFDIYHNRLCSLSVDSKRMKWSTF